ncbi:hypothetical protein ACFL6I_14195 [candidate division KSB1 bacterium]
MYCPNCNHPLLGDPDRCPNCDYTLKSRESDEAGQDKDTLRRIGTEYSTGDISVTPKIDKKLLWAVIFACVPVAAVLFIILTSLTSGIRPLSITFGGLFSLTAFASIPLIPTAFVLSILGYRSITRSGGILKSKSLAIWTMIFTCALSASMVIGAIVLIPRIPEFYQMTIEQTKNIVIEGVTRGLTETEQENRETGTLNSYGTHFPETLDSAPLFSESSPDNPFFTEVMRPDGYKLPGWKKGDQPNIYIAVFDSTVYIYDAAEGIFRELQQR